MVNTGNPKKYSSPGFPDHYKLMLPVIGATAVILYEKVNSLCLAAGFIRK